MFKTCAMLPTTTLLKNSCVKFFPSQNQFVVESNKGASTPPICRFPPCFQRQNAVSLASRCRPRWMRRENAHVNSSPFRTQFCSTSQGVPWHACLRIPPANKQLGFWPSESFSSFVVCIQICHRAESSVCRKGLENQFLLMLARSWSLCKVTYPTSGLWFWPRHVPDVH